jgi:hypothetical protein
MIGQVPLASIQTQPLFVEGVAYDVAVASGVGITSILASVATGLGRELVVAVSSAQSLTITTRLKAAQQTIVADRTFAHTGGTDTINQDVTGLLDEVEILATNASGTNTTVTVKVYVRS